jgi:replicative DNA helicase
MYHVALAKDGKGDYYMIAEDVATFRDLLNKIEDIGAEVIENQTEDWDNDVEAIQEECYSIAQLLESSDFISHDDAYQNTLDYLDECNQSFTVAERNSSLC